MDRLTQDLRVAFRQLARRPGFTVVAVTTLALGIGLATAMFSVLDGVVLRPLPYREPARLAVIAQSWEGTDRGGLSPAEAVDYAARARSFASFGVYAAGSVNLSGEGTAERVRAGAVSAGVLPALGIEPAAGRWFTPAEDAAGGPLVVLIGESLWRRRFGGAPVVGRTITVDGAPAEIVGVMPRGFALPLDHAEGAASEVFAPLRLGPVDRTARGSHFLSSVARLADGVTMDAADAEVRALADAFRAEFPVGYPEPMRFAAGAVPLHGEVVGGVRGSVVALFGAVLFVLLIACANVANLLLVRADGRRREFAIRTALGAVRGRLLGQLAVEHLVLALAGGAGGAAVAAGLVAAVRAAAPEDLPRIASVALDAPALLFAGAVALLVGLGFGLVPALAHVDRGLAGRLREGGPGATAGRARHRTRRALVVAEAALATVLVAGAGLMVRSLERLRSVDPGYRTEGLLTGRVSLPSLGYEDSTRTRDYFATLAARLGALPGVRAAGAVTNLPLTGQLGDLNFTIEGRDLPPGVHRPRADWQVVTPGYAEAIGLRLVRGRFIGEGDRENAPGAVVISRGLASRYWPDGEALGARFTLGGRAGPGVVTVVGIVEDVRHASLGAAGPPQMYLAHRQFRFWGGGGPAQDMTVVLRTDGPPESLAPLLRRTVAELDDAVPLGLVRPMRAVAAASVAQPRFLAQLFAAFSAAALVLAGVGLYGVLAYTVGLRTGEFAVRVAFGATQRQVGTMVVGEALALAGTGTALGLLLAAWMGGLVRGLLFEVPPVDPPSLAAGAAALLAAAFLAAWVPARRALAVEPAGVLRGE